MSFFTQFSGGPARVTEYTSGSGNFTPLSTTNSYARVTIVAAGGGGGGGYFVGNNGAGAGGGGGGGGTKIFEMKLNESSYSYAVGAGGTGGTAGASPSTPGGNGSEGSISRFSNIIVMAGGGGGGGTSANTQGNGGASGYGDYQWITDGPSQYIIPAGVNSGGRGGAGAARGTAVGFVIGTNTASQVTNTLLLNTFVGQASVGPSVNPGWINGTKGGCGGDSAYGKGADSPTTNPSTPGTTPNVGYGGGGSGGCSQRSGPVGAGGTGKGGYILIEEYVF